jgi:hypothetical protein
MLPSSRRRRPQEYDTYNSHRHRPVRGQGEAAKEIREHVRWRLFKFFALLFLSGALLFAWAILSWQGQTADSARMHKWPYKALRHLEEGRLGGAPDTRKFLVVGIPSVRCVPPTAAAGSARACIDGATRGVSAQPAARVVRGSDTAGAV